MFSSVPRLSHLLEDCNQHKRDDIAIKVITFSFKRFTGGRCIKDELETTPSQRHRGTHN